LRPDARVLEPAMPPLGGALVIALDNAGSLKKESMAGIKSTFASIPEP